MRSANFAYLLNVYGYKTHTLLNGYKAYRNFVLKSFYKKEKIMIVGGETGSGKTEILNKICEKGELVIDLEKLAHHKGSAFGSLGEKPQPSQEQFENNLAHDFFKLSNHGEVVWLEDESRSIGTCQIPDPLWQQMKQAPIIRVKIPKEERIERLINEYGKYSKKELINCVLKIEKRLGGQHVKHALEALENENFHAVADIALTYYDKAYHYNHEKRNMKDIFTLKCKTADTSLNAKNILEFAKQMPVV